jgi:hypothetical protein
MLLSTSEIHNRARALGESLGFTVTTEVSDSLLRLRLGEEAYRPRVDLLWSIPLSKRAGAAIAWALERDQVDVTHLPVVGIEVEATKPTTKTWVADATNLAALGVPLGLLIGSVHGEHDSYRRAARAIRSVRRSFGDLHLMPLEAAWLGPLIERPWPVGLSSIPAPKVTAPTGGETLAWSKATRARLRALGEQAGFTVAEDYIPPVLAATFDQIVRRRANPLCHTYDPLGPTVKTMTKAADLFTESKLDLAWLMPLPLGLSAMLEEVLRLDPYLREHTMMFPELWSHLPVVAFELESHSGKHAAGGLVNLSVYGILGVAVAPNQRIGNEISAALRTYQPTLGLRNVYVRTVPE